MRKAFVLFLIASFLGCSKSSDINPQTLKGSYKGQQRAMTQTLQMTYPIYMEISLNGSSWNAKAQKTTGASFLLSGSYTIEKDSVRFASHNADTDAPILLNSNYAVTLRGDSLYLKRVIDGVGEIYSLKRK